MKALRAKLILLASLLFVAPGCSAIRPSWVNQNSYEVEERADNAKVDGVDGPTGGHFDEDGNWVPDNKEIPVTYQIPDISAGFIFDINSLDVSPSLQIEIVEIHTGLPILGTLKVDAGVGYQRTYFYAGKVWTSIFEISTGIWGGWNFEDKEPAYGIGVTIIKF